MAMVYVSRPDCGVCTALKPRVAAAVKAYPKIELRSVDLEAIPAAAGAFSVFTVPAILVYVDGKEAIREARHVSVDDLFSRVDRLYHLRLEKEAP